METLLWNLRTATESQSQFLRLDCVSDKRQRVFTVSDIGLVCGITSKYIKLTCIADLFDTWDMLS